MELIITISIVVAALAVSTLLIIRKLGGNNTNSVELTDLKTQLEEKNSELEELKAYKARSESDLTHKDEKITELNEQITNLTSKSEKNTSLITSISNEKTALNEQLSSKEKDIERLEQTITELREAEGKLTERIKEQFKNISNEIIEESRKKVNDYNAEKLGELLNPFSKEINDFKKQVKDAYDTENRDKATLSEQIKNLTELNKQMATDANNLTKAIKGDVKTQGGWGEKMLENVLEASGLQKDINYTREEAITGVKKDNVRPDVIVKLPDNKHIIIDSKVTLVAYERMVNADTQEEFAAQQKQHVNALKSHIDILSKKEYYNSVDVNSPDFVLLFMPIEGAFAAAMQYTDIDIYQYAWQRNIVIVSPTTLLATLRTIASIWQNENQKKNALEIARFGGVIYDKLVGVFADLENVNKHIGKTQEAYDAAMNKMKTGNGNILVTADKMKALGAKTQKQLPDAYDLEDTIEQIEN